MNVAQMIAELREEEDALTHAIAVFEKIARTRVRRRGRPPAWLVDLRNGKLGAPKRPVGRPPKKK